MRKVTNIFGRLTAAAVTASAAWAAPHPGLSRVDDAIGVAALVTDRPADAVDTLHAAKARGLGDPAAVVFAGLAASTPADAARTLVGAAAAADPSGADLVLAAAIAAGAPESRADRIALFLRPVMRAVETAPLSPQARRAEIAEIMAVLAALAAPEDLPGLARLVAALTREDDDAETLLALLDPGPPTGALRRRGRPFARPPPFAGPVAGAGRGPFPLILPPQAAAHAPSPD